MTQETRALAENILGIDFGAGAVKVYGCRGGIELPSHVAFAGQRKRQARVSGLRTRKPPMQVITNHGGFYVGLGSHDWGRPVENLGDDRFLGAPEVAALFYGSVTTYARQYPPAPQAIQAVVGLTQSSFSEDAVADIVPGVRAWLVGEHSWRIEDAEGRADREDFGLSVERADVTSQAAGTMFDYFLDEQGKFIPTRKPDYKKEIGIISVGMNTLELLVIRNGAPVERFLASETAGVRRLLEIIDPSGMYSRGELDTQLRTGKLDYRDAIPAWTSEIGGHIERRWGNAFRRFATTIVIGGGAILLRDALTTRFNGRAFMQETTIMSVDCGLYKLGLMKQNRKERSTRSAQR
jgi:hypothetical protein